jgi:DNA-binding NtrC family response regulator
MATVLIVEDEDVLRETLSSFLTRQGHDVIAAASGYEALEVGLDTSPDVLVADWMLKNHIHGLHVSAVFRALHPNLNTILITGFPSRDLLEESDRCGISRLLEKPFDLRDFDEAVSNAPRASGRRRRPPAGHRGGRRRREWRDPVRLAPRAAALRGLEARAEPGPSLGADRRRRAGGDRSVRRRLDLGPTAGAACAGVARALAPAAGACGLPDRALSARGRAAAGRRADPDPARRARGSLKRTLVDRGPVVVIERDGVVRRLLVAQIERAGALCYPSDDLKSALRLLQAEPRVRSVMVDFALAGREMAGWVARIRAERPDVHLIGTGGIGSEAELLGLGVSRVLRKPWRINDLIDALDH